MDKTKNYYGILGVLPTVEPIVIRAAYRALAMKYHPDKWTGDTAAAERRMREINEAYEILSNDQSRKQYDGVRKNKEFEDYEFENETTQDAVRDAEQAQRKINDFLKETELKNLSEGMGTWGLGTMVGRASAKPVLSLMSLKSATDQILISANREVVVPIIAETLVTIGLALKDPALFGIPTATFVVLMGRRFLGWKSKPCLVFVTLKAVSESSTHVFIEGYAKEFSESVAPAEVKRVRDEISVRFR